MASRVVSVSEVLDSVPFTSYQVLVGVLCFCCMLFDGFDLSVIGLAVPKIAEYLHVSPKALGLAMSAGQLGPLIGAALLGMLADRIGRRKMLLSCAFGFGFFTLLCVLITSVWQLALFRFIAGLGLGGAIPTAIAFGADYAPTRARGTFSTAMYAGVPTGSTISGLSAAYLLSHFGWRSIFVMGGLLPIAIGILMLFLLPESLTFLVRRASGQEKARTIVAKIAPALGRDREVEFCSTDVKRPGVPVKHLFLEGRAFTTVLLWICFLIGYYLIFLLLSWAPTLLHKSGASVQQYSISFGLINFGSAIATVTVGWLMDKFRNHPHLILQIGFIIGFLSLAAFGYFSTSPFIVIASLSVMNGLFICGTVSGLVALVTLSYPNDITGSAVGWAFAIGRGGATLAPMVGGIFIGLNWSVFRICGVNAIGALVIIGLIALVAADSARVRKAASNAC
ncbi:MAG TPA: MFS transporter [Syntrophorhabdales bacterium]|nr:MFS transporter [Syntrophorhabdales bacterium]